MTCSSSSGRRLVRAGLAGLAALALAAGCSGESGGGGTTTDAGDGGIAGVKLSFTPASVAFGNGLVGIESAPVAVILKNIGSDTSGPVVVMTSDKSFKITSNQCTGTLAPESSCTVSLSFAPDTIG